MLSTFQFVDYRDFPLTYVAPLNEDIIFISQCVIYNINKVFYMIIPLYSKSIDE